MTDETLDARTRIVDAFMARLGTTPFGEIELTDVARDAGVTLGELRRTFDGRLAILTAFSRGIDAAVLDRDDPAMAAEPARDRLFDVLMRRLDILAPYRAALRMLAKSVKRDPMLAAAMNPLAVRSMSFMLAAANIPAAGMVGSLRSQGLAIAWLRILDAWVDDNDPGLARTMVAVDREISRGERLEGFACRVRNAFSRLDERFSGRKHSRTAEEEMTAGEGI
jgi:hypothetical protein